VSTRIKFECFTLAGAQRRLVYQSSLAPLVVSLLTEYFVCLCLSNIMLNPLNTLCLQAFIKSVLFFINKLDGLALLVCINSYEFIFVALCGYDVKILLVAYVALITAPLMFTTRLCNK